LRAQPPTTSVSPQEIERLSVAIKELETARERDKAALIDQVAKLLDEFKRRELGGGAGKTDSDQFLKHTVQRGEYLSTIAKRYGVTVAEIQKTNKLSSDLVKVGQVLLIPKKD
jgi:nucleoid-associated protein YgaU